jgi:hypothetical protein
MKRLIFAVAIVLVTGVAFGQTFKKGGVIALHRVEVTLAPGVSIDQFQEFYLNTVIPEFDKLMPGATFQFLKGIGENNQHQYASFHHWETLEAFHVYWNDGGTPTEKGAAAMAKLQPLLEDMNKLGTYTMVPGDWLIMTE